MQLPTASRGKPSQAPQQIGRLHRRMIGHSCPKRKCGPVAKVEELWRHCGSMVQRMEPGHRLLPCRYLIAFTICGTADDLADESRQAVLQFVASGFR